MKRSSFLKFGLAIGTFFSTSFNAYTRPKARNREDKGFKVDQEKTGLIKAFPRLTATLFIVKYQPEIRMEICLFLNLHD